MSAVETIAQIAKGDGSVREATEACFAEIDAREKDVRAWAHFDRGHAAAQAAALDEMRAGGGATGPLHGVAVGIKDIFDTADMPTENGLVADYGRRPEKDATVVRRLRQAGAVILGKTVTTEAAYFAPRETRNPHDLARTPGGSSSGSAAAVAAGMVPLAVGTQTNGSMIRPASFCGAVGFKPTFGMIPRTGALMISANLDHVGVFAQSVDDVALLSDCLFGPDGADLAVPPMAPHRLLATAQATPPRAPRLAFVRGPTWDRADPDMAVRFEALAGQLGDHIEEVQLGSQFDSVLDLHHVIMATEMNWKLTRYDGPEAPISWQLRQQLDAGKKVLAKDYLAALDWRRALRRDLAEMFARFDAIVAPAATGEAPADLTQTGDPAFCTLASLTGTPAVSLPLLQGEHGLPIGVQLVGPPNGDGALLRTANWLMQACGGT